MLEGCNTGTCYEVEQIDSSAAEDGKQSVVKDAVKVNKDAQGKSTALANADESTRVLSGKERRAMQRALKKAAKAKKNNTTQEVSNTPQSSNVGQEEPSVPLSSISDDMYLTNSFAGRLASSLAKRGIKNIDVIGFRGQVSPTHAYSSMPEGEIAQGAEKVPLEDAKLKVSVDKESKVSVAQKPSGPKSNITELDFLPISSGLASALESPDVSERHVFPVPGTKNFKPLDPEFREGGEKTELQKRNNNVENRAPEPGQGVWAQAVRPSEQSQQNHQGGGIGGR